MSERLEGEDYVAGQSAVKEELNQKVVLAKTRELVATDPAFSRKTFMLVKCN